MKAWNTFLDYVMPWVSGVEQPMTEHAIKLAAIEFFTDARCDRRTLATVATVAGSHAAIALTLPSNELKIVRIERVRFEDGDDLEPLMGTEDTAELLNEDAEPAYFRRYASAGSITVLPYPDAVYSLIPSVSLRPHLASTGIENDDLAERYAQAIGYGAIGKLLAMPRKPWTDAATAAQNFRLFKQAARDALDDANAGDTSAPARVRSVFGLR